MAELETSGLDLIREYIPDLPEYNPADEPGQYNIPYVPHSQPPEVPDYQPTATTNVPEPKEEEVHVKFADPPASPAPIGDVLTPDIPSISGQLQLHASDHPTSDADIILHPENSGAPKGKPLQVISKGIPPEEMSDTDLDEELQHPKHPTSQNKEEGEWTDTDEDDVPPLIDVSDEESKGKEPPPDP